MRLKSLRELLEQAAPARVVEAARVLQAWQRLACAEGFGAEADYRGGRLILRARSHAEAQELSLRAHWVRSRVNELAGAALVREVRVLVT